MNSHICYLLFQPLRDFAGASPQPILDIFFGLARGTGKGKLYVDEFGGQSHQRTEAASSSKDRAMNYAGNRSYYNAIGESSHRANDVCRGLPVSISHSGLTTCNICRCGSARHPRVP